MGRNDLHIVSAADRMHWHQRQNDSEPYCDLNKLERWLAMRASGIEPSSTMSVA